MSVNVHPAGGTVAATGGCGCGCGGGCGGGPVVSQPGFLRPRFFAGQLLTEDDLELLIAYVTGKDRLRNRYLFGAGVVCGLEVACPPCGGGKVKVQPGYALDCCGRDIVVACAEEVDVNALVRDLRIARLGEDCGDPCAGKDTTTTTGGAQQGIARHYCLYLHYAEEPTDPVAPYATEEPCGQGCEPSRVREGFNFLLRCEDHEQPADDAVARVLACLPSRTTDDVARRVDRLDRYGRPLLDAVSSVDTPVAFEAADAARFRESLDALAEAAPAPEAAAAPQPGDEQARSTTDRLRVLAGGLARLDLQDPAARAQLQKDHGLDVDKARASLAGAAERLGGTVERVWADRLDREAVAALLAQSARLAEPKGPPVPQVELRMLAQGVPFNAAVLTVLREDAASVREWLLRWLDQRPNLTDCALRDELATVATATGAEPDTNDRGAVRETGAAAMRLAAAHRRTLVDCVCAAINPPCAPCEDTGVLLACLEVRDCEVVRICNAARDFVLGGSALRYWGLGRLHEVVEQVCCAKPRVAGKPMAAVTGAEGAAVLPFTSTAFAGPAPERPAGLGAELLPALAQLGMRLPVPFPPVGEAQRPADATAALAGQLAALSQRVAQLSEQLSDTRSQLQQERGRAGKPPAQRPRRKEGSGGS